MVIISLQVQVPLFCEKHTMFHCLQLAEHEYKIKRAIHTKKECPTILIEKTKPNGTVSKYTGAQIKCKIDKFCKFVEYNHRQTTHQLYKLLLGRPFCSNTLAVVRF